MSIVLVFRKNDNFYQSYNLFGGKISAQFLPEFVGCPTQICSGSHRIRADLSQCPPKIKVGGQKVRGGYKRTWRIRLDPPQTGGLSAADFYEKIRHGFCPQRTFYWRTFSAAYKVRLGLCPPVAHFVRGELIYWRTLSAVDLVHRRLCRRRRKSASKKSSAEKIRGGFFS